MGREFERAWCVPESIGLHLHSPWSVPVGRNTAYLLGMWGVPIALIAGLSGWLIYISAVAFSQGMGLQLLLFVGIIGFSATLAFCLYKYQTRRFIRLLQSTTPNDLIVYFEKTIRPGHLNRDA